MAVRYIQKVITPAQAAALPTAPTGYEYLVNIDGKVSTRDSGGTDEAVDTTQDITAGGAGYKEYKFFCTQVSTSIDGFVVAELKNDFGVSAVWSYANVGTYTLTMTGAFTSNDKVAISLESNQSSKYAVVNTKFASVNQIQMLVSNIAGDTQGSPENDMLTRAVISVKQYY